MSSMHVIRNYKKKDYVKILLIVLVMAGFMNTVAAAPTFSNSGGGSWQYYKEITIRENSGSVLSDYQIPISLSSSNFPTNGMSDGADIRFTDSNGNELSYWIESWDNVNSKAKIWVKVKSITANSNTIIRMYYANPSAFSASQPKQTMLIYEDMQTQPSGNLAGSAVYDATNNWVQLTSKSPTAQKGYLYYLMNPGNGFVASFEFWSNKETGEGFSSQTAVKGSTWLGAYDSTYSGSEDVTSGGYHFTYDEAQSRIAFTKSTSIDGAPISSASVTNIANSQWHRAKINFFGTTAKIYYDDSLIVDSVDTTYKSDKSGNYFIFGGGNVYQSTGVQNYNDHRIRNIIVSKYISPEPTLMFSIEQPIATPTSTTPAPTTPTPTPTPTPTTGSISIDSVPEGASVYLDGIYKGKAPKLLIDVPKGPHQIKISLDGYNDWSYSTLVTAGVTSNVKATLTPAPTSTIQTSEIKQRAQLQVTYEVGSLINDRLTIKVFLKNVGDATASNINLTIEHSHELEPIAASGSEKIGDTISWTGELLPNTEHIIEYSVKAIKGKDVEIPLKVTYAKISREEKAKALGISPSASVANITPEDVETIVMIIKILKAAFAPGFELIMAISILFLIHVFLKNRIRS